MRIAAGILMIIGAALGIIMLHAAYGYIPGLLGWLPWFWAFFVGGGGLYTLKRKAWRLCLASSILLLPMGTVLPFLVLTDALSHGEPVTPFAVGITTLFFVLGIIPIIFVCLRKREWES